MLVQENRFRCECSLSNPRDIRLFERNRTLTFIVMYSLYLYFIGLSLHNTSKALIIFKDQKRSYLAI